jgi:hypothetical protein
VTEHDQSRDRPGDQMARLTVAEAADQLGITEAGVRKRIQRGQIPHERDDTGRVFVWISPGETRHAESRDQPGQSRDESRSEAPLVEELRDRIRYLERQVEEERSARFRADQLLARLMERIPELEPPSTPEPPEPREEPDTSPVPPERAEPAEPVDPQREEPERVEPQRVQPERAQPSESPVSTGPTRTLQTPAKALSQPERGRSRRKASAGDSGRGCWADKGL